jgi:hypothetical protein
MRLGAVFRDDIDARLDEEHRDGGPHVEDNPITAEVRRVWFGRCTSRVLLGGLATGWRPRIVDPLR